MRNSWIFMLCTIGLTTIGCTSQAESIDEALSPPSEESTDVANSDPIVGSRIDVFSKMAMTWTLLGAVQPNTSNAYVLIGSDAQTNPYTGDTSTWNYLPLLCINKDSPSHPGSILWGPSQTPGGAWRQTWSGGTVALTTPIQGASLTSLAVANAICSSQFGAGFRMAEFHDGAANLWSGWDFWGAVLDANLCSFQGTRFWVSINDQNSNPW